MGVRTVQPVIEKDVISQLNGRNPAIFLTSSGFLVNTVKPLRATLIEIRASFVIRARRAMSKCDPENLVVSVPEYRETD